MTEAGDTPQTPENAITPENAMVVFVHAHPDDEAIFTGGVMRLLADHGFAVALVCATSGEAGTPEGTASAPLGTTRRNETLAAARRLGVCGTTFLDHRDSGLDGEVLDGFAHTDPADAAVGLARAITRLAEDHRSKVAAVVIYDSDGTYGHPDHIQVHRVGLRAAQMLDVDCVYEATVDREYLHFVETHLVIEAGLGQRPESLGLASTSIGRATVEIDLAIDVSSALDTKRAAMAEHGSQLPPDAAVFRLARDNFAAVHGTEWFLRRGPRGPLDLLTSPPGVLE